MQIVQITVCKVVETRCWVVSTQTKKVYLFWWKSLIRQQSNLCGGRIYYNWRMSHPKSESLERVSLTKTDARANWRDKIKNSVWNIPGMKRFCHTIKTACAVIWANACWVQIAQATLATPSGKTLFSCQDHNFIKILHQHSTSSTRGCLTNRCSLIVASLPPKKRPHIWCSDEACCQGRPYFWTVFGTHT